MILILRRGQNARTSWTGAWLGRPDPVGDRRGEQCNDDGDGWPDDPLWPSAGCRHSERSMQRRPPPDAWSRNAGVAGSRRKRCCHRLAGSGICGAGVAYIVACCGPVATTRHHSAPAGTWESSCGACAIIVRPRAEVLLGAVQTVADLLLRQAATAPAPSPSVLRPGRWRATSDALRQLQGHLSGDLGFDQIQTCCSATPALVELA